VASCSQPKGYWMNVEVICINIEEHHVNAMQHINVYMYVYEGACKDSAGLLADIKA